MREGGSYDPAAHSRDCGGQSAHSAVLPIITLERAEDVSQHCQRTLSRFFGGIFLIGADCVGQKIQSDRGENLRHNARGER